MRNRVLWLLLLLLASPGLARSADFQVPPTPDHYVTDLAGALSPATRDQVDQELRAYEKSSGHQVIVWIDQTTGDVPLESWTAQTAHTWKIGHKKKDDGAVLFVFMKDHKIRIEVGYGLEGALPDAQAKRIIDDDIRPAMKAHDVDLAVKSGINDMLVTITPSYKPAAKPSASPAPADSSDDPPGWFLALFIIFIIGVPILTIVFLVKLFTRHTKKGSAGAGTTTAQSTTHNSWFSGGDDSGSSDSGSDFSSDGGDFGGGGASGDW